MSILIAIDKNKGSHNHSEEQRPPLPKPMIVLDADHNGLPLGFPVARDEAMRFYGCVPLVSTELLTLGWIHIASALPRASFSTENLSLLEHFAVLTVTLIEQDLEIMGALSSFQDPRTAEHPDTSTLSTFRSVLQYRIETEAFHPRSYAVLRVSAFSVEHIGNSLGQDVGNLICREIERRLGTTVSLAPGCLVSQLNDCDFLVLMDDVATPQDALTYAAALEFLLGVPFATPVQPVYIRTSIGVAFAEAGAYAHYQQILDDVSLATLLAKSSHENSCLLFAPSLRDRSRERLQLESDLREALELEQFELYYQPFINLTTLRTKGFEALIRWKHPERGMVPPDQFIPLAEETGLITQIGRWVAAEAIRQLGDWRRRQLVSPQTTMAVNLSTKQFHENDLLQSLNTALHASGVPAACLVLEITESTLLANTPAAIALMRAIRDSGIGLDLDDFGTGYSSLSYLHQFPFRCIKIDRSFIRRIDVDQQSIHIVAAVITLANSLSLNTIAEGVETEAQVKHLLTMGCSAAQGYLFSAPLPAHDIEMQLIKLRSGLGPSETGGLNALEGPETLADPTSAVY